MREVDRGFLGCEGVGETTGPRALFICHFSSVVRYLLPLVEPAFVFRGLDREAKSAVNGKTQQEALDTCEVPMEELPFSIGTSIPIR